MIQALTRFLDHITMYRLLLYYLLVLLGAAMLLGALGVLSYNPLSIALTAGISVAVCYGLNYAIAKFLRVPTNGESALLTGLILSLVITPLASVEGVPFLLAASGLAIASKYILAIHNKHIFNPVAIAIVLTAFGPQESASWWVGTTWLMPLVVIGGFLVAYKIRRLRMVLLFILVALGSTLFWALIDGKDLAVTLSATLLHSSFFFLGFVMLTEPATSPTTNRRRYVYAAIVGLLFAPALHIGTIYATPELALVVGNVAAFLLTPAVKTRARVIGRRMFGERTEELLFAPERAFRYQPGQYVEMTLPHAHADVRGLRRYFTLASSPTERELRFGVRYYAPSSTFKQVLHDTQSTHDVTIGQLGGDFVMPRNTAQKLAFIAGGIGVTPFRSMVKYLTDTNEARDVALLYAERSVADVAYADIFEEARQKVGVKTTYLLEEPASGANVFQGRVSSETITALLPDYKDRLFYISGPQPMVQSIKAQLRQLGVPRHRIKTDYFSGYA